MGSRKYGKSLFLTVLLMASLLLPVSADEVTEKRQ